jgi:hypothetical protein
VGALAGTRQGHPARRFEASGDYDQNRFDLGHERSPSQATKSHPSVISWITQFSGWNCGRWISRMSLVGRELQVTDEYFAERL